MALPFMSPARTVLIIGDESLSVYAVTFNAVRLADTVPWTTPDFEERVVRVIRNECGAKPILLVNDMTDQHFKGGQRLPKVSIMDRQNVLERKLQVAFPNYPIRGALEIKQARKSKPKINRGDKGEQEASGIPVSPGMYLFAAVPMSEPIAKTIASAKDSLASITQMVLLPVDSSDMVAALAQKVSGKDRSPSRWVVFIGQHRGGALRQVIIRDGQLAMTRMTPVAELGQSAADWAADVSQELKATVSYLSRFGYSPEDGTDLIVISTPEAGDALKDIVDIPCNFIASTVNEAARILGIGIGLQEDQHYADPLHAAWIGRKTKFILPMRVSELANISRPRQYATAAMLLLGAAAVYFGWLLLSQMSAMSNSRKELTAQNQALIQAQAQENIEVQRMQQLGFDVKLIQASMASYATMQKAGMDPLSAIHKIGQVMGGELRLTTLKIDLVDPGSVDSASLAYQPAAPVPTPPPADGAAKQDKVMLATLTMNFPSTVEPKVGVKQVNDFHDRLQTAFPGYTVTVTRQVADLTYTTATSGKSGVEGADATKSGQDYIAELQIKGPAHD